VIPIRTEIIKFCETIGFDYMGAIIWQKVTTTNTTGGAAIMGSFPYPRNGILKIDYEFILLFKKQGDPPQPSREQKERSMIAKQDWNTYFSGHWHFAGAKQDKHIAMFPGELPARLIKMFSFVDETVLDPFLGSGTTTLAARNLGRNSVGYEINRDYIPVIKQKLNIEQDDLFKTVYKFLKDNSTVDLDREIKKLPYVFRDPHKLDKKIDPGKHNFGSRIDKNSSDREEYFSVKEVLSPELIRLSSGLLIRLIGVRENKDRSASAVAFINEKTRGQKVFLKYDRQKYDSRDCLLCYVYLKNKTFLNAHLIKEGLVDVDNSIDFKYKEKFLGLAASHG
jgi:site-specific DNA-methyltransferase (adenine-specific)